MVALSILLSDERSLFLVIGRHLNLVVTRKTSMKLNSWCSKAGPMSESIRERRKHSFGQV